MHPKLSTAVALSVGVQSLRSRLLTTASAAFKRLQMPSSDAPGGAGSAGSAALIPGARNFGQVVSLIDRLRSWLSDNPENQVWAEFVANADDAGARV